MKRLIIIILLLLIMPEVFSDVKITKYAGAFLEMGVGARPFGMGGAFTALSDDVTALYWNPAGLINIKKIQFHGMHAERFSGIVNWDFGGIAARIDQKTSFALGFFRLGVDGIPYTKLIDSSRELGEIITDDQGREIRNTPYAYKYVNDSESALFLSFSRKKSDHFSYGGSIKIIHKSVDNYNAWGLGFDFGIMYTVLDSLKLGMLLSDGTSTILAWNTGRKELIPPHLRIGTAYSFNYSIVHILPVFDLSLNFENRGSSQIKINLLGINVHAGMELRFKKIIAFRTGINSGYFTAGSGLRFSSFNVDYGFSHHSDLGNTHRISLTYLLQ